MRLKIHFIIKLSSSKIADRIKEEVKIKFEGNKYQVKISESSDPSKFKFMYEDNVSLEEKIRSVAQKIYRADDIVIDKSVSDQLKGFEENGYGNLPICIAKTQYSFSTNPSLRGAPNGFTVPVREVRLSAGAGFIVVVTGQIMTMPGLPKEPSANSIMLDEKGLIQGLF